ncbi:peptidoglycan-binding domain-containing protein [Magnetospirillum moscoviense]|nr:peptidoglycan-binding domain-containing protein [Magnetospirillum moscoviense]
MLNLKSPIGTNYRVDPNDLMDTKRVLNRLGYYDVPPERGIDDWTDDAMFDGIKRFQKDNGLKVDGFMRPEGPAERTMNAQVAAAQDGDDWEYAGDVDKNNSRDVITNGPAKVEIHNPGPSWNGLEYKVDWYGLDKDGKVIPEYRRPDHDQRNPSQGGIILKPRTEKVFEPPFENPNGYSFRVTYPPQGEYSPFEGSPHIKVYRTKKR